MENNNLYFFKVVNFNTLIPVGNNIRVVAYAVFYKTTSILIYIVQSIDWTPQKTKLIKSE